MHPLYIVATVLAARAPLPQSVAWGLSHGAWRLESSAHRNSYIFRVDEGADGSPGVCVHSVAPSSCCSGRWYIAGNTVRFAAAAGLKTSRGAAVAERLDSWARAADTLVPTSKVDSGHPHPTGASSDRSHQPRAEWLQAIPPAAQCAAEWTSSKLVPFAQAHHAIRKPATTVHDQYFIYSDVGTLGLLHADVVIVPLAQEIKRGACTAADGVLRGCPSRDRILDFWKTATFCGSPAGSRENQAANRACVSLAKRALRVYEEFLKDRLSARLLLGHWDRATIGLDEDVAE